MSADDAERELRVLMAEFRGEVSTNLAELRGDVRVVRQQSDALADKVDRIEDKVEQMRASQPGFVTKDEVDRKLRNGTAIVGTSMAVLTLLINTLFMVITN